MSNKKTTAAPEAGAAVKLNPAAVFLASLGIIADAESDLTIGEAETSLVTLLNEYSAPLENEITTLKTEKELCYSKVAELEAEIEKKTAEIEVNATKVSADKPLHAFEKDGEKYHIDIDSFRFLGKEHKTEDVIENAELLDQVFEAKPFFIKKL